MPSQPTEEYHVEFILVPDESWHKRLFHQILAIPQNFFKVIHHTYLIIRHAEIRTPLVKGQCPMRRIWSFSSLIYSAKVTSPPLLMKAIFKQPKKDPKEGIFDDRMAAELFFPLLRDLFPNEAIGADDFFLTADKSVINKYRAPVLQFIGLQNIRKHGGKLWIRSCLNAEDTYTVQSISALYRSGL
jgi:hypothetical protein